MSAASAPAPFRFDIEKLLHPISPDAPAGISLRYEGTYDEIRANRQEDDPVLDQGVWKTPLKKANWEVVERVCIEALMSRSKDLQLACWLLEAWLHQREFAGAAEGFRVVTALSEHFWDVMYPLIEDGDLDYRIAPIHWLNEKIPVLLKLVPITAPSSEDMKVYCWADWETACRPKRPEEKEVKGRVTQALFQQSAMLTPTPHLRGILRQLEDLMDATQELEQLLEARCGRDAPSLRQFNSTLEPMRGLVAGIVSQRGPEFVEEVEETGMPSPESRLEAVPAGGTSFSGGPITNRSEAYMRLEEIANFLARTEPHSPTPYLIRRAIAWGSMRLEDLLPELVSNRGDLDEIYRLLQMNREKGK